MKNSEIMLSVEIQSGNKNRLFSFLVKNNITLKSLIQGLYYGLKKMSEKEDLENSKLENSDILSDKKCFKCFEKYIKTHTNLLVLYTMMGEHRNINFTEEIQNFENDNKKEKIYNCSLTALGIVTSSVILISDKTEINDVKNLFRKKDKARSYILKEGKNTEYNISSRRLNVVEPTQIDILPAGDVPENKKDSLWTVVVPPLITAGAMLAVRTLVSDSSTSMLAMSIAMPVVSMFNTIFNYVRQNNKNTKSVDDWKKHYEEYISKKIKDIAEWQRDEIIYLNKVYPQMKNLLDQVSVISPFIFCRSQNDNDFMRISLGVSEQIRPLFEIKAEKKDDIFYDVRYHMVKSENNLPCIEIFLPQKKKNMISRFWDKLFDGKSKIDLADIKNVFLLTELPNAFATTQDNDGEMTGFKYLRNIFPNPKEEEKIPPLLVDLRNIGTLGVISENSCFSLNFIKHIAFELAFYHSPEDLQMVFFFDEENDLKKQIELVGDYMFLPHTNELFDNLSQFVFDKKSAGDVFSSLQSIMFERSKSKSDEEEQSNEKFTQIICFVLCDYDIKGTAFSKFIPEAPKEGEDYVNTLGLTFVFISREKGMLPKYCGSIVELSDDAEKRRISNRYNLLSHETLSALADNAASTDDIIEYTNFSNDIIFNGSTSGFELAFKQLSSIYYTRIAENGKVPALVTLFELYEEEFKWEKSVLQGDILKEKIIENWENNEPTDEKKKSVNDVTKNMRVAMGKNEHGITYLDLHENSDGPHMLVAGTTGSGKSETIITYLIGLCVRFSPMELNLLLVDMKGGGFSDRLGDLPHCVGTVTNTAGENEGISAAYMLKRFLTSLNAEIKNRQIILSQLGVDNTDAYMRVYRKIKHIHEWEKVSEMQERRNKLISEIQKGKNEKQIRFIDDDISELKPLSHLVLVVDEFTELKRFSSESGDIDFIAEITTIARVGRTLGLHIILISQNIEGAINDDIRVNTKSKICLKVATKQASKEMLGTTDAAAATMPGHGRAYILVGTGSRYEYFQSAYTGANKNMSIELPVEISRVNTTGHFDTDFYSSDKDNTVIVERNKNVSPEDTQLKHIVTQIIAIQNEERCKCPAKIFQPPLSTEINDEKAFINEWEKIDN